MVLPDWSLISRLNHMRRQQEQDSPQTLVLTNVKVFDGQAFEGPKSVFISHGRIVQHADGAQELDCSGKFLIPGLIDAHCHPLVPMDLDDLTKNGVTTAMSMAGSTKEHMASLKGHHGLVDMLVAGLPAAGPDNRHTKHMPGWPMDEVLTEASQASAFVDKQLAKGAEYIKIISDQPGMAQDILDALTDASRSHNQLTVTHAATIEPARMALKAKSDQLHHIPIDALFNEQDIELFKASGAIVCPTLSMMEASTNNIPRPGTKYAFSRDNVTLLHKAGIPVICGTDANKAPGAPASVPFGTSIHHELQLLVEAGLSHVEALRSATILAAQYFGLKDRGAITPGFRADMVLLSEDPVARIEATSSIEKVWVGGIEYSEPQMPSMPSIPPNPTLSSN